MNKKKIKKLKFDPANLHDTLFVYLEQDGDNSYSIARPEIDGLSEGTIVGVYELVRVAQITVDTQLEDI